MKILVLAGFAFALTVTSAPAQTRTLPRPFLTDTLSSAEEYAAIIEACEDVPKGSKLVATCEQLVESFNRAFTHLQVANHHELATYVRDLAVKPCPSGPTRIARIVDGTVDLDYRRNFREGERCLYDTGEGVFISSMSCGQWTPGARPVFTAFTEEKKPEEPKPAPQTAQPPPDALPQAIDRAASRLSKTIDDAAARLALEAAKRAEAATPPVSDEPSKFRWLNPKTTKGKIFWGSVGGAIAGGALYCTKTDNCRDKVVVINNIR